MHFSDINPVQCCGYKNVFIHYGINDIKHYKINTSDKIRNKFNELKNVIEQIMVLCPNTKIHVSPILPTKIQDLNYRANHFNESLLLFRDSMNGKFNVLNFGGFCDEFGWLRSDMGRYWNPDDQIHLGLKGVNTLVHLIRQRLYNSVIYPSASRREYSNVLSNQVTYGAGASHGVVTPRGTGRATT